MRRGGSALSLPFYYNTKLPECKTKFAFLIKFIEAFYLQMPEVQRTENLTAAKGGLFCRSGEKKVKDGGEKSGRTGKD